MKIIGAIFVPVALLGSMASGIGDALLAFAAATGVFSFAGWLLQKAK